MTDSTAEIDPEVVDLVADVVDDFRARRARGEEPDPEDYAARHPQAATAIRGVLAVLRLVAPSGPAADPPAPLSVPVAGILGDYRIVREIGRGGMGVVYEAEQISLSRRVALKVLPFAALADPRLLQRFHNEARAAAVLDHPHVVKVYGVGHERGVHFIAMQFVDGRPLSELIAAVHGRGPSDATEPQGAGPETVPVVRLSTRPDARTTAFARRAAELGVQAAEALEHAHALGVVHRDVKPGNLLLDARGDVWVSDFGLAKVAAGDAGVTLTGDVFGTLRYMSPEQALAKHDLVDHRTDVYALGATLYELLTGRPAVDGRDRAEILRRITDAEPAPVRRLSPAVPRDLETVILKCLRKEPNDRYASARELADDLRRFLNGEPVKAKPIGPVGRATRWTARRPTLVLLLGLTALAIATAVALGVRNHYRAEVDRTALQTAAEREGRQATELRATQDAVERQRFFTLLEQVRQHRADPYPGWSGENLKVLRELATLPPADEYLHDLRTEAADALSAADLIPAGTIGSDFQTCGLDYSPDGRLLAAGYWCCDDDAARVRLYDAQSGERLEELLIRSNEITARWVARSGWVERVLAVRFSPDGRWLVAGLGSGQLVCWDARNYKAPPRMWAAHVETGGRFRDDCINTLAFTSDSNTFVSGAEGAARVWRADGRPVGPLIDKVELPGEVPNGQTRIPVLRAGRRRIAYLNLATAEIEEGSERPGTWPLAVAPGGYLLAYKSTTRDVPVLQHADHRARPRELTAAAGPAIDMSGASHLAFDPSGGFLASLEGSAHRVKLWDVATGRLAVEQTTLGDCPNAVFRPDGGRLAVASRRGVVLFDVPNRVLETTGLVGEGTAASIAATPDHSDLVVLGREAHVPAHEYRWRASGRGYQCVGDRATSPRTWMWDAHGVSDYSRDGTRFVCSVDDNLYADNGDTTWEIKDLQGARFGPDGRLWVLESHLLREKIPPQWADRVFWRNDPDAAANGMVLRVVEPGSHWVFVGRRDGRLFRVDSATGAVTGWPLLETPIAGLALSPEQTQLLVGGEGTEVRLVNTATGESRTIPDAHRGSVPAVAFGRHFFVTGSADRRVRLWTADGRPLATLRMQGPVRKVLLSDDERSLLVLVEGERAVRRWRLGDLFREWRALGLGGDLPPV